MKINAYATHVPILAWAVANTVESILELGAGAYSTPLIHALAGSRRVLSFETDERYVSDLAFLQTETRSITHTLDPIESLRVTPGQFGLAFVDCAPAESRRPCVEELRMRATVVIVHDTNKSAYYNLDEIMARYTYSVTCRWFDQWTTVLSMNRSLADLQRIVGAQ